MAVRTTARQYARYLVRVRDLIRKADAEHGHGHGVCRVCGCTEHAACRGGCGWIEIDLCSRCVGVA
jgi:hypothetical protein